MIHTCRREIVKNKTDFLPQRLKGEVILTTSFYDMNKKILEKKNKTKLFPNFQLIPIFIYKLCMIMCIGITP